jgi:hypothetical protein
VFKAPHLYFFMVGLKDDTYEMGAPWNCVRVVGGNMEVAYRSVCLIVLDLVWHLGWNVLWVRIHVLVCSWICGKATNFVEEFFRVGFLVGCRGVGVEWALVPFLVHWRFV